MLIIIWQILSYNACRKNEIIKLYLCLFLQTIPFLSDIIKIAIIKTSNTLGLIYSISEVLYKI